MRRVASVSTAASPTGRLSSPFPPRPAEPLTCRPTRLLGERRLRWDQFRCELLGRLEEDANGEIDRAAVREQPDRVT